MSTNKRKEYRHQYYLKHRQKEIDRAHEWQLSHPEETKTVRNRFSKTEKGKICSKKHGKKWLLTPAGRKYKQRQNSKRRKLKSTFMNEPFEGSEGHHLDNDFILHIPKELHRSIPHNLTTGYNMELINTKAFEYIISILKLQS